MRHRAASCVGWVYEIRSSGIQAAMIGMLQAWPRTPLYDTNVIPLRMSYDSMVAGYRDLYERLLTDTAIAQRVINRQRVLRKPGGALEFSHREGLGVLVRLLCKGVLSGGPGRVYHFVRSLPWRAPGHMPQALSDWIVGLSMRDYALRHLRTASVDQHVTWGLRLARQVDALSRTLGAASVRVSRGSFARNASVVTVAVSSGRRQTLLRRTRRQMCRLLSDTSFRLTLHIGDLRHTDLPRVHNLLRSLVHFGERVSIEVSEAAQLLIAREIWPFDLVLRGAEQDGAAVPGS